MQRASVSTTNATKSDGLHLNDVSYIATMSKNNFNFQYVIGRGGFGKVSVTGFERICYAFDLF